jgi:hypothetical protein
MNEMLLRTVGHPRFTTLIETSTMVFITCNPELEAAYSSEMLVPSITFKTLILTATITSELTMLCCFDNDDFNERFIIRG